VSFPWKAHLGQLRHVLVPTEQVPPESHQQFSALVRQKVVEHIAFELVVVAQHHGRAAPGQEAQCCDVMLVKL
jgi:hypothetical protein